MSESFIWRDAGRAVVFGRGGVAQAPELLRKNGLHSFELLSTARALPEIEALAEAAEAVREVAPGAVPETSAALLDRAGGATLVAYGGGRVIDTAKAVASITGAGVVALPTTMSGAEMTGIHRLPAGAEERSRGLVRPQLVIADPEAMTSQPEPTLRASSMNALAHGADSLYTPFANPVSRMTALRGARLIALALDQAPPERERASLALGSVLCGYAIDSGMFAIHHVICQTLVRVCGAPHGFANAAILPRAMAYMAPRAPEQMS
ncbi:MAG TPA: iron-containing alcohol dehydrogenase, partial [Solirubrobacterales bacterium]|nr:iron-containing alcohol dehydrogenase [Solirubrobacterales bacterium]